MDKSREDMSSLDILVPKVRYFSTKLYVSPRAEGENGQVTGGHNNAKKRNTIDLSFLSIYTLLTAIWLVADSLLKVELKYIT